MSIDLQVWYHTMTRKIRRLRHKATRDGTARIWGTRMHGVMPAAAAAATSGWQGCNIEVVLFVTRSLRCCCCSCVLHVLPARNTQKTHDWTKTGPQRKTWNKAILFTGTYVQNTGRTMLYNFVRKSNDSLYIVLMNKRLLHFGTAERFVHEHWSAGMISYHDSENSQAST